MLRFVMRSCFLPSIRLFTKMLQIQEFVNSPFCGCCIIPDFVPVNQNVSTGNGDTSNAAYTSQKEQNYLIEFRKLAKWCICNIRLQNLVYFLKRITIS